MNLFRNISEEVEWKKTSLEMTLAMRRVDRRTAKALSSFIPSELQRRGLPRTGFKQISTLTPEEINYYITNPDCQKIVSLFVTTNEKGQKVWSSWGKKYLAVSPHLCFATRLMKRLANDPDEEVRVALASSHHLTDDIYRLLVKDSSVVVRARAARNEKLPLDLFNGLLKDKDNWVRIGAEENPSLPDQYFHDLMEKNLPFFLKMALARNRALPKHYAEQWIQPSNDPGLRAVRKELAKHYP